jgi:hypothetical protein
MNMLRKTYFLAVPVMIMALPGAASAQTLLQNLPVKISVGNGAPLTGNAESTIGVGILNPGSNRTPISLRVLGGDKTVGLSVQTNGQPIYLGLTSPTDGALSNVLPK